MDIFIQEKISIKTYSHKELALIICSGDSLMINTKSRKLSKWLRDTPDLLDKLKEAGWKEGVRSYTPKMVKIIIENIM